MLADAPDAGVGYGVAPEDDGSCHRGDRGGDAVDPFRRSIPRGFAGLALSPPSVTRAMQEAFQFRIGWLPWASCLFMYKPMSRFVASVSPPIVCGIWTQRNPSGTSNN